MSVFRLVVVSAEREMYSGDVSYVACPGSQGELGVLPRHAPLMTMLRPGVLELTLPDGKREHIYVSGGILEVQPDQVMVLADVALRSEELDEKRAEEAHREAEQKMQAQPTGLDYAAAQAELAEAMAQIQAIRKLRNRA